MVESLTDSHRPRADPADVVDRLRATALTARPSDSEELGVDRTTLSALRGFIEGRAVKAGLGDERVDDLVYAVNEVVTNSICHGEGRARVSFWTDDGAVTCEVRDRGWIRDPLAGRVAPTRTGPVVAACGWSTSCAISSSCAPRRRARWCGCTSTPVAADPRVCNPGSLRA